MRRLLTVFAFWVVASPSWAQLPGGPSPNRSGSIVQTGNAQIKHVMMWAANGVAQDAGPAGGGVVGVNPSEMGITNTGTPLCVTDGPTTSPYHQLCVGANGATGALPHTGLITYNAYQGATPLPLTCVVNGTTITNCLQAGTGNVKTTGNATTNDLVSFADTSGLNIKDSGFAASLLNPFTGDAGSGGVAGIVPAPPAGSSAAGKFLAAGGGWTVPSAGGATTLTGVVVGSGVGTINTTFTPNSVTNSVLAPMNALTIKGNNTTGAANPTDLTQAQVTAMLNPFSGDAGAGGVQGLVPAPAAGDAAAGKILGAGGAWVLPSAIGSVTWPPSGNIVISNGTNTPASLAPVNNDLVYGTGGAWAALGSANSAVLVTSAGGVPSFATTLPSGLTIPSPVISSITNTGTLTLPTTTGTLLESAGTNTVSGTLNVSGTFQIGGTTLALPVSVANGGTGLASGTSGGVLAFTGSTTLASSAALTANLPVIGGGAGAVPTVGTVSGNTTKFATVSGSFTNGHCVDIDVNGNLVDAGGACGSGGTGTVTSVGLSAPGGGVFGVTGSPVATTGTLGLTATGTSGGVLYFASASTISSSAVLTANLPVIGGGAGIAPSVGTVSGNTTKFGTVSGSLTSGDCIKADASGNLVDAGAVCNAGTVTSVGLSVPGSSIFGVTGTPVTSSGTLGLTTTGTSGGIPYFSSTSALSSSALLTANLPVIGGGAGTAPTVGTRSGNTTKFVTTTGTLTSGDLASWDASGNAIQASLTSNQVYQGNVSNIPVAVSLSTAIDNAIGLTQGSILERSASGWVILTPGTSGQVFTSNGPGADPTYQTPSVGAVSSVSGTAGQITVSPTTGAVVVSLPATITSAETFSGAVTLNGTLSGTGFASPPALGGTTPAAGSFTTLSATGNLTTNVTGSTQCLQVNSSGVVSGAGTTCSTGGVTWPASNSIVVSNGTSVPAGLAPVINRLAVGTAGPSWGTLATANNAVLVTSGGGIPSISSTLPSGLSIPGFAPLASPTFTGTPAAPTATQGTNSTQLATTGWVKLQQLPLAISWLPGINPNNALVFTANQAMTIQAIVGRVEVANGTAVTVTVNKAPNGTACSAGTILHSGSLNANGTAATNQTLTLVGGATDTLNAGDTVCLQTGGGTNWTNGSAAGSITIFATWS